MSDMNDAGLAGEWMMSTELSEATELRPLQPVEDNFEMSVVVREPLYGRRYEFRASIEDGGIMLCVPYDYHGCDVEFIDPDEANDEAWEALDAMLGFDVRKAAVETGIGGSVPPLSVLGAVSYAVLPFEMALLVRRAMRKGGC